MPDREYHAIVLGKQQGPFTYEEMVELAAQGKIMADTMGWTDGMSIWRPLGEVPGLRNLYADAAALPAPAAPPPLESLLPDSVDAALDRTSRSQAFIIGAGIFFALIAVLGIGNIFSFRRLALLSFWGSAALAYFAYQAWRQEEAEDFTVAAVTSLRGALGAWGLAFLSLVFGNWLFAVLQGGAGGLFWLARSELQKQASDIGQWKSDQKLEAPDDRPPTTDRSVEASQPPVSADPAENQEPESGEESSDG